MIAVDTNGNAIAVWFQFDGTHDSSTRMSLPHACGAMRPTHAAKLYFRGKLSGAIDGECDYF